MVYGVQLLVLSIIMLWVQFSMIVGNARQDLNASSKVQQQPQNAKKVFLERIGRNCKISFNVNFKQLFLASSVFSFQLVHQMNINARTKIVYLCQKDAMTMMIVVTEVTSQLVVIRFNINSISK